MMNQIANTLKSHGVKRGERVVIYMPVSPHAVAAMLACARIGAAHSVVFAGFSSEALASRIQDGEYNIGWQHSEIGNETKVKIKKKNQHF